MILDVLDGMLSPEEPTCGAGLAHHSSVPRRVAVYLEELAATLALHREMLVASDRNSQKEDAVYRDLASSFREAARRLRKAADRMAAQFDLPMGAHEPGKWTERHTNAFTRFVHEEDALMSVLRVATLRDQQMLASLKEQKKQPA